MLFDKWLESYMDCYKTFAIAGLESDHLMSCSSEYEDLKEPQTETCLGSEQLPELTAPLLFGDKFHNSASGF